jgi:hypothetical protein
MYSQNRHSENEENICLLFRQFVFNSKPLIIFIHTLYFSGGHRGRYYSIWIEGCHIHDRMVVGLTTTYAMSACHH